MSLTSAVATDWKVMQYSSSLSDDYLSVSTRWPSKLTLPRPKLLPQQLTQSDGTLYESYNIALVSLVI